MDDLREGYAWRAEREQKQFAYLCALIMNASGRYRGRVRPADLLPKKITVKHETRSREEQAAELHSLLREFTDGDERNSL